ncbi:MAG: ABC transporter ATP-binding protein [Microscillaceae bacterium]|jgi:iron(III) transport system ATP-binding protein|nr:ABC transporter ATP-binding protein [Microscillaceae bacterium]
MIKFLEIDNLSKNYADASKKAVCEVSLDIARNELVALVGENGSGKTTLLKLIAGLIEPDTGTVHLLGAQVLPPSAKLIAGHDDIKLVFQDFQLLPNHSVRDNLRFVLQKYALEYQNEQLAKILKICRLEAIQQHLPRELSGGQKQRVALAKALITEPELLLLDEPFSQLDQPSRQAFRTEIRQIIRQTQTTAILVTHDFQEALALADRIVVMQKGEILQIDSPQKIYEKPRTKYVAEIFGAINWLPPAWVKNELKIQLTANQIVGIRPENLVLSSLPQPNYFQGKVEAIFYAGFYQHILVKISAKVSLLIMTEPANWQKGELVYGQIKTDKLIFVAQQSEPEAS